MKRDIESRADIDALMVSFYAKAMTDPVIGHFFTEVVQLDLEHHLPVIGDFWETALFGSGAYRKHGRSPLEVHAALDARSPLRGDHFERWLQLFTACVDESFEGMYAGFAKQRGQAIARRMLDFVASRRPAYSVPS
jgi:hemoglobin